MKTLLLMALLLTAGCGNHSKEFNGVVYNCYGAFDKSREKKPEIIYEISGGNMIGVFLLSETIFVPVWNLGWNVYCPKRLVKK